MKIGIFGRDDDPIADHTEAVARSRGHEVLRIAFGRMQGGAATAFDGCSWLWLGDEIEACDGFVVRQYPAAHALLAPPDEAATAGEWFQRGMSQVERSSYAQSAIMDLELMGKPIVNPLLASGPFDHKPLQLSTFYRAGLPIPRTFITNFPDAVRIFDADVREAGRMLITKPTAGGAETLVVDDAVRAKLDSIVQAPVIFQERIEGPDVRVTVVGGEVISSVVVISEDGIDYRRGDAYRRGEAQYVDHPLSDDVKDLCVKAADLCHHVLSGVDLKRDSGGGYTILEANSAPVYLDIERKTGAPITAHIVAWLERRISGAS
jgi:glutathione synthase/RimK-type ligase-like ATP-grasp enzyme